MSNQDAERNEQFGTHEYWQARYTGLSAGGSDEYDWFKKVRCCRALCCAALWRAVADAGVV